MRNREKVFSMKILTVIAIFFFCAALPAAKVRVPHTLCNVTIEYSPKVITVKQLLEVVRLHREYANSYASRTPHLGLCTPDENYKPCGQRDLTDSNFLPNAKINLDKSRAVLKELNDLTPPKELLALKAYHEVELTFYVLLAERQLSFYETGDKRLLSEKIMNIEPASICTGILTRISKVNDANLRFPIVSVEYANCLNHQFRTDLGPEPLSAWEAFKKAYHLKEEFECF